MAEEAVIAKAVESWRQDVQEKAPDEFRGAERHPLLGLRRVGAVVRVVEAHVAVVDVDQPMVGDGDPVGVAADVVEHLWRAGEGRFRVDDPLRLPRRLQMIGKALRIGQRLERCGEPQELLPTAKRFSPTALM